MAQSQLPEIPMLLPVALRPPPPPPPGSMNIAQYADVLKAWRAEHNIKPGTKSPLEPSTAPGQSHAPDNSDWPCTARPDTPPLPADTTLDLIADLEAYMAERKSESGNQITLERFMAGLQHRLRSSPSDMEQCWQKFAELTCDGTALTAQQTHEKDLARCMERNMELEDTFGRQFEKIRDLEFEVTSLYAKMYRTKKPDEGDVNDAAPMPDLKRVEFLEAELAKSLETSKTLEVERKRASELKIMAENALKERDREVSNLKARLDSLLSATNKLISDKESDTAARDRTIKAKSELREKDLEISTLKKEVERLHGMVHKLTPQKENGTAAIEPTTRTESEMKAKDLVISNLKKEVSDLHGMVLDLCPHEENDTVARDRTMRATFLGLEEAILRLAKAYFPEPNGTTGWAVYDGLPNQEDRELYIRACLARNIACTLFYSTPRHGVSLPISGVQKVFGYGPNMDDALCKFESALEDLGGKCASDENVLPKPKIDEWRLETIRLVLLLQRPNEIGVYGKRFEDLALQLYKLAHPDAPTNPEYEKAVRKLAKLAYDAALAIRSSEFVWDQLASPESFSYRDEDDVERIDGYVEDRTTSATGRAVRVLFGPLYKIWKEGNNKRLKIVRGTILCG